MYHQNKTLDRITSGLLSLAIAAAPVAIIISYVNNYKA